jgi:predicted nucleotide-binding protein (sugar kinase/HSP70/actin superfamily)
MPAETDTRRRKTIFIPRMADHAFAMRSAFRASGFNAEVLPESDEETLYWGKKFSSGKECFPFIATTGDIVKMTKQPSFDPETSAFFMPTAQGPCRFGQYRQLQRVILDRLNLPQTEILSLDSQNS